MKEWTSGRHSVILIHTAVWTLFFTLSIVSRPSFNTGPFSITGIIQREKIGFLRNVLDVIFFYCNAYFLLPKLAYRKKYLWFIASLLFFFILSASGAYLFQKYSPQQIRIVLIEESDTNFVLPPVPTNLPFPGQERFQPKPISSFFFGFFPFLTMLGLSTTFRLVSDKVKSDRARKEKENEGLKTELSFLRSQTSPHFLFNIMNSMVAMARLKLDQLEPSLIRLSGLLRYMLYDTDDSKVPMTREIEFLESYVELQQLRFGENIDITLRISNDQTVGSIEPMFLIPFVENAFKHGATRIENPFIITQLEVKNNRLTLRVENKYNHFGYEVKDASSGIGLANVRRRLNLLYPQLHDLKINDENGVFTILLQINF